MRYFYVSSSMGNDSNDGSINAPFKTLQKVNSTRTAGDVFHFKAGDIFYGRILRRFNNSEPIVYKDYGIGPMPVISPYTKVVSGWANVSGNVWRVDLTVVANIAGNTAYTNTNIGHLWIDKSAIFGDRKFTQAGLAKQWDFYADATYLYVYSVGSPATKANSFEVAPDGTALELGDYFEAYNLRILGSGGHGVAGGKTIGSKCVNLKIENIGGSVLNSSTLPPNTRYGNGWELFNGGLNNELIGCRISQCYDVAATLQGGGPDCINFETIDIMHNVFDKNTQSLEFWSKNNVIGYYNVNFKHNFCQDAGYGWGYDARPDKEQSVHLLFYDWQTLESGINISENHFYRARNGLYYALNGQSIPPVVSENNYIFLDEDQPIRFGSSEKVEDFKTFVTQRSKESGSRFFRIRKQRQSSSDILASAQEKAASALSQIKQLSVAVFRALGSISVLKSTSEVFRKEIDKLQGYSDIYTYPHITFATNAADNKWAQLARFRLTNSNDKIDFVMSYMLAGDSLSPRGGVGTVNVQIVPTNGLTAASIEFEVSDIIEFPANSAYAKTDFRLVREIADGNQVVVGLYFNVGKKAFGRLAYKVIQFYSDAINSDVFTFYNRQPLILNLPAGSQTSPNTITPISLLKRYADLYTYSHISQQTGSLDANKWAPLCKMKISHINHKIDLELAYMLAGDSVSPRGGVGRINVQLVPTNNLNDSLVEFEVVETVPFPGTSAYSKNDFKLVKEKADGTDVVLGLYFNIGKKAFGRISTKVIQLYTESAASDAFTLYTAAELIALPAGTTVSPA